MDSNDQREPGRSDDEQRAAGQDRNQETPSADELRSAPPGSSIINPSRSGQAVSDNPVLRVDRDAGDVLADEVREEREGGEGSSRS